MRTSGDRMVALALFCILLATAVEMAEAGSSSRGTIRGSAPVRTASAKHGLDPSNFVVVIIAALILVYGAKVSNSLLVRLALLAPSFNSLSILLRTDPGHNKTNSILMREVLMLLLAEGSEASIHGHVVFVQSGGV